MKTHKFSFKNLCQFEYRVTINYIVFGLLWIFLSDEVLDIFISDAVLSSKFQTFKGASFVLATAIFLYFLVRRHMKSLRNAELELRKLNQAVEQSPVGICVTNFDGIIEYINPKLSELTGYSIDELKFKDTSIFSSGETTLAEYQKLWKTIQSGKIWHGEFHNKKKNGELYWESSTISPVFDTKGQITHFLAIKEDITDRKLSELALNESEELLRKFSSHLQNVREEEKIAIAREIHDDLGQTLVALKIDIGMLKNIIYKNNTPEQAQLVMEGFGKILNLTDRTIKTVRRIMNGLRPELLEINGFISAASSLLQEFEERYHIVCEFNPESIDLGLDSQQSLVFFRILQESLNNVAKHAKATKVRVQIKQDSDKLVMEIIDDGTGFDIEKSSRNDSYGMLGMKERAVLLGGELEVTSNIGGGTSVKLSIPWSR